MSEEIQTEPRIHVKYTDPNGQPADLILADKPITIGRSPDADIITLDERASRMHCGIRLWDGEYYIKDLKSKNGTYLNNERVEMAKIKPGDKIRLGNTVLLIADRKSPGTVTTLNSVQNEMNEGKGYKTILREIVEDTEKPLTPVRPAAEAPKPEADAAFQIDGQEPRTKTAKLVSPPPEAPARDRGPTETKSLGRRPSAIKIKRK
jgi:pSer/pThr/pTyr-binding forkhead associated (FHA) protein